jgi:rubredoxin-NAD+ reductase
VLSAAGLVANTQLAEKAGLAVARGIMTDRLMQTSAADVFAIGDCAAVEGQVFAYIEPIRRQAATIAAKLVGDDMPFDIKPPLVRIKTPSLPLTVCPPSADAQAALIPQASADAGRVDFRSGDRLVGFVLSGTEANNGMQLYRELYA